MPDVKKELIRKDYTGRINRVIDYIEANISRQPGLDELAGIANFSKYHFHRIFAAFKGETLNCFIRRKKLEKAASLLLGSDIANVADIGFTVGFTSQAAFSRAFKEHFGKSPTEFRDTGYDVSGKAGKSNSNFGKTESNDGIKSGSGNEYIADELVDHLIKRSLEMNIEVKEMPEFNVAYYRHVGAFDQIGGAYEKLFRWAGPRGLLNGHFHTMTVYHDDPKVTEIEKLQQSACITLENEIKPEGEIGVMKVPGGRYAVGRFEIKPEGFTASWDSMCHWLAQSGYQPADSWPYELYHNDHTKHPEGKFILDICIPVKAL